MTLATFALTTADALRDEIGVTAATLPDPRAERLIAAASQAIQQEANGRSFERVTDVVEDVRGHGGRLLIVPRAPIVSITSIALLSSDGTVESTYAATDYFIEDGAAGLIAHTSGWPNTAGYGDGVRGHGVVGSELRRIRVTYTAGWITPWQADGNYSDGFGSPGPIGTRNLPYDIEMACIQAAAAMYRSNAASQAAAVKSEKLGNASVTYFGAAEMASMGALPPVPKAIAAKYWRAAA